ncbi:UPF0738 family protein [Pseudoneobacillus sp. C159]
MKKKIPVSSAKIEGNHLLLHIDSNLSVKDMSAKEQMLVDSDQLSFIYIVEAENEYTYIALHKELWETLKRGLEDNLSVYLSSNDKAQLLLPMFLEELKYLIENIKGNSNYGEEMVEKVESSF